MFAFHLMLLVFLLLLCEELKGFCGLYMSAVLQEADVLDEAVQLIRKGQPAKVPGPLENLRKTVSARGSTGFLQRILVKVLPAKKLT